MSAPHQPLVLTPGRTASLDFAAVARELMEEDAFERSGRVARTLVRGDNMTVVVTVMKKDAELHDHSSPGPTTVTVLRGSLLFSFAGADDVSVREGSAVVFAKDTVHSVVAKDDSAFVLLIGGRT